MKKKLILGVVVVVSMAFLFPVVFTVISSFMMKPELTQVEKASQLAPNGFSVEGYYNILIETVWFLQGFWNSILYAVVITVLNVLISVPAAYAFHEAEFRGKKALYFFYIVLMMMPLQVTILPNYIGLRDLHLIDTRWAILLPGIFTPFGVFLMCQYMSSIEHSTLEAARIETKSIWNIVSYIAVPQVKTCIVAMFVFIFAENWNLVEQPNVYLKGIKRMPLSVLLATGQGYDLLALFAGSVIFMIPVILLYLYFHESLEVGLENLKL